MNKNELEKKTTPANHFQWQGLFFSDHPPYIAFCPFVIMAFIRRFLRKCRVLYRFRHKIKPIRL